MDSFEWNKIAGAVLGTALFVMVVKIGTEAVFFVPPLEKQAYVVEGVEETGAAGATTAAPAEEEAPDWAAVIPTADINAGMEVAKRCAQCHTWDKGGPNKIGPNQWGIVGRERATHEGFSYSAAMKNKGGTWTYDELFHYLRSPARWIPGNKMAFVGLPKAQDRINLIAYMRTWADSPAPLPPPKPKEAAPPAGAPEAAPPAAAGGDTKAPGAKETNANPQPPKPGESADAIKGPTPSGQPATQTNTAPTATPNTTKPAAAAAPAAATKK
jgi:cytochrome c